MRNAFVLYVDTVTEQDCALAKDSLCGTGSACKYSDGTQANGITGMPDSNVVSEFLMNPGSNITRNVLPGFGSSPQCSAPRPSRNANACTRSRGNDWVPRHQNQAEEPANGCQMWTIHCQPLAFRKKRWKKATFSHLFLNFRLTLFPMGCIFILTRCKPAGAI